MAPCPSPSTKSLALREDVQRFVAAVGRIVRGEEEGEALKSVREATGTNLEVNRGWVDFSDHALGVYVGRSLGLRIKLWPIPCELSKR